jgi:hypothetical protein
MPDFSIGSRFKQAWNAFFNKDPTPEYDFGSSYYHRPDRTHYTRGNDRSIVTSVFNRISLDVASIGLKHVQLDKDGRYEKDILSGLNNCLTLDANLDQTGRAFIQDVVASMMDEGCVAICPIVTDDDPTKSDSYGIENIRAGRIVQWYPSMVRVELYNEFTGKKEEVVYQKRMVAIVENPLYAVVNEPNSTAKRLMRKLSLLDFIDERNGSDKLNMLIQLPYGTSRDRLRDRAQKNIASIEEQLSNSRFGIAYTDSAEHVFQLNRPLDNTLLGQIEFLTGLLYSQLGITKEIMDGTATPETMLNYYTRTIEPILAAISDEMKRKFLTQNARTRGQTIAYYRDQFRLVPLDKLSEMLGTMITNRVMTSNEARQIIGMKPSNDPNADKLTNPNVDTVESTDKGAEEQPETKETVDKGENQNVEET